MGIRHSLVGGRYFHDSTSWEVSFQHGVVGLRLPSRSVFSPIALSYARLQSKRALIGVFTLETIAIGEELESRFFKVLGTVSSLVDRHPSYPSTRIY